MSHYPERGTSKASDAPGVAWNLLKFITRFHLILLFIPLSLQAQGEAGDDPEMSIPPPYLDELGLHPLDQCKGSLLIAYDMWRAYHQNREYGTLTREEAKEVGQVDIDAHSKPSEILTGYAIDLVYDGKGLRETEKAVFRRCRYYYPITDEVRETFSNWDKARRNTK